MSDKNEFNIDRMICIGQITSPHGIQGVVKVKSYTNVPSEISFYSKVYSEDGKKEFNLKVISSKNDIILVRIDDIKTRDDAEKLKNLKLYVPRSHLPEIDDSDEFYYEDLIGMDVKLLDGVKYGEVTSIDNYGSHDVIEILNNNNILELFPFTKEIFPVVDINKRFMVIVLPEIEFVNDNNPQNKNNN